VAALLVWWLAPQDLAADDWPAPQVTEVFSANREWFVRVLPGKSLSDTVGFAGAPKGPYARAEWYLRTTDRSYRLAAEASLANPVAPVKFLVTDRGYLVTLDNWHNMGYGKAVASYSPDGKRVAAYELKELFSATEVAAFRTSVSSIWWRTDTVYVREGQASVFVGVNDRGAGLILSAETGDWQFCDQRAGGFECRRENAGLAWGPFVDPPAPLTAKPRVVR